MRLPGLPSRARVGLLLLALATTGAAPAGLPPIVFVSRQAVPGEPRAIPGLGPHQRATVTGGRLLLRETNGRVRELLSAGSFVDVSDPSVSPSGRRIAFAGVARGDSTWRIWVIGIDGSGGRPVTSGDPVTGPARFDDLDPCWISDTALVFASTRFRQNAQYADLPVTNLFVTCVDDPSCAPRRITAERNGAEEPAMDWSSGRILFTRWWFNRYLAAHNPQGITTDRAAAIPGDTVNLWQVMSLSLEDRRARLAGGDLSSRRGMMGYQPAPLADGSIAAVYAANLGLSPRTGGVGIHLVSPRFGPEVRLAGALVSARDQDAYRGTEGLAPPAACSPVALPDRRVLFAYDPGARGEFGLYVVSADGSRIERVLDLPGTLELDPAPVVVRRAAPRQSPPAGDEREDSEAYARALAAGRPPEGDAPPGDAPPISAESLQGSRAVFRYHNLDVFADGALARGAPPRTAGTCIRFFATLARPERSGGDSVILVREVAIGPSGEVNERGLPADVPMFEQLVGPDGRVLMTAHGPAHVAGSNVGVAGIASRCVGCHLGHSTLALGTGSAGSGRR